MTLSKARNYIVSALFLGVFAITACQKKDEGGGGGAPGGGGVTATTPCTATCDNQHYQGFVPPTAYTYGANGGFCGCGPTMRPIYNSTWGYSCVQASYMSYGNYMGYNASSIQQGQNNLPSNMTQLTYAPLPYGGTGGDCFTSVAAACLVSDVNSCGAGGFCRPIGGGSRAGVCVRVDGSGVDNWGSGNTAYPPNYNPYNYNGYQQGYNSNCRTTYKWGIAFYICGYGY